ncbi:glycosyl hydrolases family 18 domain-containing protein [Hirsutella rhossiliensis]|uniref:chitinase n=1 Tax=Hirsutella rhossiliensis TaxID=111463 RepID=A0A9P8MQ85_9HYPO|nr:glycosyl hydrolases family 18 domain-containing protein [Hirsutella rhossiliensis]KAH0959092.1 glycosyl hydrolases family 18 domain-containing protein [Hirsutella rhossiliensis]
MRCSASDVLAAATAASAGPRYIMYLDQYHLTTLPPKDITAGVNVVITAFAPSATFNNGSEYTPFKPLNEIREMFDSGTKVCMAIGGWGDLEGFGIGAATDESRKTFAKNVANTVEKLGYDCVDVDWEYPGGNGEDYKNITNDKKTSEIESYPMLLSEIKQAIGDKELSIAVPARKPDLIAYTAEQMPKVNAAVDFVNVMTYDIMNRRDNVTNHQSSVVDSKATIEMYMELGVNASKMNLGFALYAKFFETDGECTQSVGCPTVLLEFENGTDTQKSGAVTFETQSFSDPAFAEALKKGNLDSERGGQWYWDPATKKYWTWDTPQLVTRKFNDIVKPMQLGGVFAWSMTEDSNDWGHIKAMQAGVKEL